MVDRAKGNGSVRGVFDHKFLVLLVLRFRINKDFDIYRISLSLA
jgi:hypothetical protein